MDNVRAAAVQFESIQADKAANLETIRRFAAAGCRAGCPTACLSRVLHHRLLVLAQAVTGTTGPACGAGGWPLIGGPIGIGEAVRHDNRGRYSGGRRRPILQHVPGGHARWPGAASPQASRFRERAHRVRQRIHRLRYAPWFPRRSADLLRPEPGGKRSDYCVVGSGRTAGASSDRRLPHAQSTSDGLDRSSGVGQSCPRSASHPRRNTRGKGTWMAHALAAGPRPR